MKRRLKQQVPVIVGIVLLLPPYRVQAAGVGEATLQDTLLEVELNGQNVADGALLLRAQDGALYVRSADLSQWRLRLPQTEPLLFRGETFIPLQSISGLSYRINEQRQALEISVPAHAFQTTVLAQSAMAAPPVARADPGGFLNYDLFVQETGDATTSQRSALFELGFFNSYGAGTSSFLAEDSAVGRRLIRLDSSWIRDDPAKRTSLRIGDAFTRAAAGWGRSIRFGGIQYATNFSTQPYFLTLPLQSVSGEAVVPSTVDVFVNKALVTSKDVPSGPFSIQNLPAITGSGEMQIVVRDVLGRERVVSQPFYASSTLLRYGLEDFSVEAGAIRQNFGQISDDYGRWFAAGTYRKGMSDRFTGEVHAEAVEGTQATVGLAGTYMVPLLGLFNAALAGSTAASRPGGLAALGFERQAVGGVNFSASTQWASSKFAQLGLVAGQSAPRQLTTASANYFVHRLGAFGFGYVVQEYYDRERVRLISGSYSVNLGKRVALTVSALKSQGTNASKSLFAVLTIPLGDRTSSSVSFQNNTNGGRRTNDALVQIQQGLPAGEGFGYRARAGIGTDHQAAAGVSYQSGYGTYSADVGYQYDKAAFMLNASGGSALIGTQVFAGRRINDSFGVVQVPGYPNVRVYADNQLVARTDQNGYAFLPRLRPYENNPVSVNQLDLPLDAKVDALQIVAVPYARSGVSIKFPIRQANDATLRILLDDGQPLPAGAQVGIVGGKEKFPVALRGEVYLTGLARQNQLRAEWRGQTCDMSVTRPQSSEPLPDLGTLSCQGVQR